MISAGFCLYIFLPSFNSRTCLQAVNNQKMTYSEDWKFMEMLHCAFIMLSRFGDNVY